MPVFRPDRGICAMVDASSSRSDVEFVRDNNQCVINSAREYPGWLKQALRWHFADQTS